MREDQPGYLVLRSGCGMGNRNQKVTQACSFITWGRPTAGEIGVGISTQSWLPPHFGQALGTVLEARSPLRDSRKVNLLLPGLIL